MREHNPEVPQRPNSSPVDILNIINNDNLLDKQRREIWQVGREKEQPLALTPDYPPLQQGSCSAADRWTSGPTY